MYRKPILLLIVLCSLTTDRAALSAQTNLSIIRDGFSSALITPDVFRDPAQIIRWDSVRAGKYEERFVSAVTPYFSYGSDPANWWLRFKVKNDLNTPKTLIFRINRKNFDVFDLYLKRPDHDWAFSGTVGSKTRYDAQFILTDGFHYAITLPPGESELIARAENQIGAMFLGLSIHSPEDFNYLTRKNSLIFGLFCGVMFISLIFAFLLYCNGRDHLYIFYILYLANILLRESFGYSADFGILPSFQRHVTPMFIAVSFGIFAREYMQSWKLNKWLDRSILAYFYVLSALGLVMWYAAKSNRSLLLKYLIDATQTANLGFTFLGLIVMLRYCRTSPRVALLLLSYMPMAAAFVVIILRNLHFFPNYPFIQHSIMWAFIAQVLILTIGFVYWLRGLENEQQIARVRLEMEQKEHELVMQHTKERIARDLHDDVAASISGIRLLADVASKQVQEKAPEAAQLLNQINQTAQATAESVGDMIWVEKPGHDTLDDLADRIREFAVQVLGAKNIEYQVLIPTELPSILLNAEIRRNILLIFKEAVNNALKYSEGQHLQIRFGADEKYIHLMVSDDGLGFDTTMKHRGHGLKNMAIRAKEIGAQLEIRSVLAAGTIIELRYPL